MSSSRSVGYKLGGEQLVRVGEIFRPFFSVLESYCSSHVFYKVSISGEPVNGVTRYNFAFQASNEDGNLVGSGFGATFIPSEKSVCWSKGVIFEKGAMKKVYEAFQNVIDGINTIDIPLNSVLAEAGDKWVFGAVLEDRDQRTDVLYNGHILFLKSNRYFGDYGLKKDGSFVEIDDFLEEG